MSIYAASFRPLHIIYCSIVAYYNILYYTTSCLPPIQSYREVSYTVGFSCPIIIIILLCFLLSCSMTRVDLCAANTISGIVVYNPVIRAYRGLSATQRGHILNFTSQEQTLSNFSYFLLKKAPKEKRKEKKSLICYGHLQTDYRHYPWRLARPRKLREAHVSAQKCRL